MRGGETDSSSAAPTSRLAGVIPLDALQRSIQPMGRGHHFSHLAYHRAYVAVVVTTGRWVILAAVTSLVRVPQAGYTWLLPALLTWLSALFALKVPGAPIVMTITESVSLMIAIGIGWRPAVVTVAIDGLIASLRQRSHRMDRMLVNAAEPALAMAACAFLIAAISGLPPGERMGAPLIQLLIPACAGVTAYLLLNSGLTAGTVALENGSTLVATWRQHARWLFIDHLAGTSLALLAACTERLRDVPCNSRTVASDGPSVSRLVAS
jgi:hypothetical protein